MRVTTPPRRCRNCGGPLPDRPRTLSDPKGLGRLRVGTWVCGNCGATTRGHVSENYEFAEEGTR